MLFAEIDLEIYLNLSLSLSLSLQIVKLDSLSRTYLSVGIQRHFIHTEFYSLYTVCTYKSASTLKQFTGGNISWRGLNTISEFSLLLGSVHSNSSPRDRSRWETSAEPIGARTHAHIETREHLNRVLLARLQRRSATPAHLQAFLPSYLVYT